jgi:hypothetical protein
MAQQVHKRFSDAQVKELIERYLRKEIERKYIQEILGIKKRRLFMLVKQYRDNPKTFSIRYTRKTNTRSIPKSVEKNIVKELSIDKRLIEDKNVPLKRYNYSYVKSRLENEYQQKVSLSTIINRAKQYGFYLNKKSKKSRHDREVLTNYIGELIQHDSSHHLWSPPAGVKWYLITSLDDYSRFMLYATLLKKETSWAHIDAAQTVFLKYGLPYSYYVDSHRIFRFVQGRDSIWRRHHLLTDDVDTQWKQVMKDCGVKVIYALSPAAKGKVERPYGWLQDRLIRTCVRENVTDIRHAQRILRYEVHRYNYHQVHSTTQEVPYYRFQKAQKENRSLFREFAVKHPYESVKDICAIRINRIIDPYRKISIKNFQLKVNNATPRETVNLRIYPLSKRLCEVRMWCKNKLIDVQKVKTNDLKLVHF